MAARQWLLIGLLAVAGVLSSTSVLDQEASAQYESAFKRALVTFALARTLNGVVSMAQGTELALQPAGVGLTLTPGELLDPVNDLIERFSWIMLASSTSLYVQNIFLDISRWWGLRVLVVLFALAVLAVYLNPNWRRSAARPWIMRVFLLALFLRLAVPLVLLANDAIYRVFLEPRYEASSQIIEQASEELEQLGNEQQESKDGGILGSVNRALSQVKIKQRLERFKQRASEIIEQLITLSAVFLLQTVVLPLAFLWLLVVLFKRLLAVPKQS